METEEYSSIPESTGMLNGLTSQQDGHCLGKTDVDHVTNRTPALKVNGGNHVDNFFVLQEDSYSSESDALVIDESIPKRRTHKSRPNKVMHEKLDKKSSKNDTGVDSNDCRKMVEKICCGGNAENQVEHVATHSLAQSPVSKFCHVTEDTTENRALDFIASIPHSNPYFNESLFELSQLSHLQSTNRYIAMPEMSMQSQAPKNVCSSNVQSKAVRKIKVKPRPCAKFLGLQPAVQFRCSKCGTSGFESIVSLQDHLIECSAVAITTGITKADQDNCSKFKLTRKVFLCSACGTYYENWNLYMHMLEFHKRYVCLYCLGMFSVLEDLFNHIQSKHNVVPGVKNSLEEFYKVYNEPCYIVCCDCSKLFTEQDNFFYHKCTPAKNVKNKSKALKTPIRPEHHVTGEGALNDTLENDGGSVSSLMDKIPDAQSGSSIELSISKQENEVMTGSIDIQPNSDDVYVNLKTTECEKDRSIIEKEKTSDLPPTGIEVSGCQKDNSQNERTKVSNTMNEECIESDEDGSSNHENKIDEAGKNDTKDTPEMEEKLESLEDAIQSTFEDNEDSKRTKEDTRKVPKLSLKIPKPGTYSEPEGEFSDDSDKMEVNDDQDHMESENEFDEEKVEGILSESHIPEASCEIITTELTELEQPLDKIDIRLLLQKCLKATAGSCIYCNHCRRIPVNGKQLGLHAIAQHRYSAVVKSITAEELHPERFVARIKECLNELENMYFNLESHLSEEAVTFSHIYECFQCYYHTTVHKELYLHNRKFHSKNLLLCIMCKSNFYSYSELICHLCPGTYVPEIDLQFRCCMCVSDDLPSSFRLMVHLRKKHNMCDVCLDMCHTQFKLSNHVWKHKLNHFCYRCGIAYRNKPDITRHLFWKHGTESIVCKNCLQKKWPHMYHFCQPPAVFNCDECNESFSKAVCLKVHKRLHTNEKKHQCTFEGCEEMFISRKVMIKHERKHWEPPEEDKHSQPKANDSPVVGEAKEAEFLIPKDEATSDIQAKPIVDPINSLPELNLSESDSSDSELGENELGMRENDKLKKEVMEEKQNSTLAYEQDTQVLREQIKPNISTESQLVNEEIPHVIENIWENFKNYQASKDKQFGQEYSEKIEFEEADILAPSVFKEELTWERALMDHDYCVAQNKKELVKDTSLIEAKPALNQVDRADHDYCFSKNKESKCYEKPPLTLLGGVAATAHEPILEYDDTKPLKSGTSSSSSSDSGSSSCSCGSNCSCSLSSGSNTSSEESSNSDSSTEEGRKRQQIRRQKRTKQKRRSKKLRDSCIKSETKIDVGALDQTLVQSEPLIAESDLETTESDTDEEFYDKQPQIFARKLLEEKRALILGQMGPDISSNGSFFQSLTIPPEPPTETLDEDAARPVKKKKKNKRKKKKSSKSYRNNSLETRTYSATLIMPEQLNLPNHETPPYYQNREQSSLSRKSPVVTLGTTASFASSKEKLDSMDPYLRASKRRRVPNKFYGYSSDEEERSAVKIRKMESPKLVPPITIKTFSASLVTPPAKQPTVEPITLKLPKPKLIPTNISRGHKNNKSIPTIRLPTYLSNKIASQSAIGQPQEQNREEDSESNESNENEPQSIDSRERESQPLLYCYCRCPYDEVSEMIGCDSDDCEIEWFHFECVGIMVPPKGQWFCPDCRKKKQRKELMETYQHS